MTVPVSAVSVAMSHLFRSRRTNANDLNVEEEVFAGHRVIAVYGNFVALDRHDREHG